ncbi:hypothetical protein [Okeania sp. SIO3I5]|uniref:hypothetical protein n=1 Tax=Okeania sp. SIO3I5 TaxID=2607805 RepID=UPI0025EA4632|nr:hypothetical protein [Okeania sp. SIO3I5]
MLHRLYGLRGKDYVKEYKRLYQELKQEITADYISIINETGKFTPKDSGYLCNKYSIPVKVMDDWLPDYTLEIRNEIGTFYPSGSWERCQDSGIKARDIGVVWKEEMIAYIKKVPFEKTVYYEMAVSVKLINDTENWLKRNCIIKYAHPIVIKDRFIGKYYLLMANNSESKKTLEKKVAQAVSPFSTIAALIAKSESVN